MYNQYPLYGNNFQNIGFQNPRNLVFPRGINSGIVKPKFNWNNFLNNTQRTLGIINQAIPIMYQVKPILNNAKTMFRIASAIDDVTKEDKSEPEVQVRQNERKENAPQFFL